MDTPDLDLWWLPHKTDFPCHQVTSHNIFIVVLKISDFFPKELNLSINYSKCIPSKMDCSSHIIYYTKRLFYCLLSICVWCFCEYFQTQSVGHKWYECKKTNTFPVWLDCGHVFLRVLLSHWLDKPWLWSSTSAASCEGMVCFSGAA